MKTTIRRLQKPLLTLSLALLAWGLCADALAALPTPHAPSSAPTDASDWLGYIKAYVKDGAAVLALVVSVGVFFLLAYNVAADLMAVRKGDKEWGDMGFGAIIGAAFFLWISYLMSQANSLI